MLQSGARTWVQAPGKHSGSPRAALGHSEGSRMLVCERAGDGCTCLSMPKAFAHGRFKYEKLSPCFSLCNSEFPFGYAVDIKPLGVRNTCHLSGRTASSWVGLAGAEVEGDRGYTVPRQTWTEPLVLLPEHAAGSASGRTPRTPGT